MDDESEAPGRSGPLIQRDLASVFPQTGRNVKNNISLQTGEEFSMEFLQDRVVNRVIPAVPDMAMIHENRLEHNYNQSNQLRHEDLSRVLGLRRLDPGVAYDNSDFASTKGSVKEIGCRVSVDQFVGALGEMNRDLGAGMAQATTPIYVSEYAQFTNSNGSGVLDGVQSGKMKFLCSFGGKILARPGDGKLRYVGGETRIMSIRKNISFEELVSKTFGICKQPHSIRYQLPGEDLDSLISVACNEDLQNMIEEYHGLEKVEGSQRLRIFLIPCGASENLSSEASTIQKSSPDYQYVVAVNGLGDPSLIKNHAGISLESGGSQRGATFDRKPSFQKRRPSDVLPLETRSGFNALKPTQFSNGIQCMTSSSQASPISPIPRPLRDSNGTHTHLNDNNSSAESNNSSTTAKLASENSSTDISCCKHLPRGENDMINYHHHSNIRMVDTSQPDQLHGLPSFNCDSSKFVNSSVIVDNSSSFRGFLSGRPLLDERTFTLERPISYSEDPTLLLSDFTNSNDSHQGIAYSFSDSKLEQCGGRSAYCSQEGTSPSSPLNFAKPQPSLLVSAALKEKHIQLQADINVISLGAQNDASGVVSNGLVKNPTLNCSPCSEFSSRIELIHKGAYDVNHDTKGAQIHANKPYLTTITDCDEISLKLESRNKVDERDPVTFLGGKKYESTVATGVEYKITMPTSSNHTSTFLVDTMRQDMLISGDMMPASSALDFRPSAGNVTEHLQKYEGDRTSYNLHCMGEKTAPEPICALSGIPGSNISWTRTIFCGAADSQVIALQKDGANEEIKLMQSENLGPPAVNNGGASLTLNLHKSNLEVAHKREYSLIDDDFAHNPDQTADTLGFAAHACKMLEEKLAPKENLSGKGNQIQLELLGIADDVALLPDMQSSTVVIQHVDMNSSAFTASPAAVPLVDITISNTISSSTVIPHMYMTGCDLISPIATISDNLVPESEIEGSKVGDQDKDKSFSDAMIAEMEASMYGLQIVKDVDLEELRELGSGTYGTVYHGKWRGTDVAIKRLKKSCFAGRSSEQDRLIKDFWREAQILSNLHHPNVVAFYGVVPDGTGGTLATVTEYMVNGSLRHVLLKDRSLDSRKKLMIAMDAAFGMEYLHSKNIVHFDLKCDNLLVNPRDPHRPICKVGDFGLSRIKRNTLVSGGVRGTLPWMAPELLNSSSNRVSEKVDVFSFGISMWEILTGDEPYADMHCGEIIGGILKNTLRPLIPEYCDPEWKKLMEECWSPDPNSRPTFTEITNRLRSISLELQAKAHNNQAKSTKANAKA